MGRRGTYRSGARGSCRTAPRVWPPAQTEQAVELDCIFRLPPLSSGRMVIDKGYLHVILVEKRSGGGWAGGHGTNRREVTGRGTGEGGRSRNRPKGSDGAGDGGGREVRGSSGHASSPRPPPTSACSGNRLPTPARFDCGEILCCQRPHVPGTDRRHPDAPILYRLKVTSR